MESAKKISGDNHIMKEKAMEKLKSADQYLEQHEKIFAVLSVAGLIALVIPFYWFGYTRFQWQMIIAWC